MFYWWKLKYVATQWKYSITSPATIPLQSRGKETSPLWISFMRHDHFLSGLDFGSAPPSVQPRYYRHQDARHLTLKPNQEETLYWTCDDHLMTIWADSPVSWNTKPEFKEGSFLFLTGVWGTSFILYKTVDIFIQGHGKQLSVCGVFMIYNCTWDSTQLKRLFFPAQQCSLKKKKICWAKCLR